MQEDKRNMILAFLLSAIVLIGWQYLFPPSTPVPPTSVTSTTDDINPLATPNTTVTDNSVSDAVTGAVKGSSENNATLNRTNAPRIRIEDQAMRGSISLLGARLDDLRLNEYYQTLDQDSANITLLQGGTLSYFAQYGWIGRGTTIPDSDTLWQADGEILSRESPVTLRWTSPEGVEFIQYWKLEDRFLLRVEQSVTNRSGQSITLSSFGLISRGGTPTTSGYYILHEGPVGVFGETLEELSYDDLQNEGKIQYSASEGWVGMSDNYWLAAMIPHQGEPFDAAFSGTQQGLDSRYQIDFLAAQQLIADQSSLRQYSHLFVGAKETLLLDQYRDERGFNRFDLAVDFGILYFITKPLFYVLSWLFNLSGNFGLAIIYLTLIIKVLFFPLSHKSYVSMSKMKLLQPKMLELKERYGEDRMKLQSEMMALYKREKVNPLSGCLPILLQIPVFFALYKVLLISIEMRHAPFFGWIQDLSAPDPLGVLTLFGLIDWQVPEFLAILNLGIWPIIMGFTMWLQQRLNPAPADPIQAKIFAWMPILFTFLLATFPAGLVIYWAVNNSLTIAQQWTIMRSINAKNNRPSTE